MRIAFTRLVGHVILPAAAIGFMSIMLVAGMNLLGLLNRMDLIVAQWLDSGKPFAFPKSLPLGLVWSVTGLLAFAVSYAILQIPNNWQRVIIWISAVVSTAAWAPILALAAYAPVVSGACIAVLWSGVCSVVYAGKQEMPTDIKS